MRVVLHIGLHKTGTSSFQRACRSAQQRLMEVGVLYPSSRAGAQFAENHSDLAHAVLRGEMGLAEEFLEHCRAEAVGARCSCLLLSSEDFCLLFEHLPILRRLEDLLEVLFEDRSYVLVLRDARSLLPSGLKQRLVHCGGTLLGAESPVDFSRPLRMARALEEVLKPRLVFVSYEGLMAREHFCNALLERCVGLTEEAEFLEERRENVGSRFRDRPELFLTPVLRAAVALVEGENPYAGSVEERLESLVDLPALKRAFRGPEAAATCEELIDRAVALICERALADQGEQLQREFGAERFYSMLMGETPSAR